MSQDSRLFVGNVPNDVDESRLNQEFACYGLVKNVEIKQKNGLGDDVRRFAFVTLNADHYSVNKCIDEISQRNINGQFLQVSVAKESFMERLKREREEREKQKGSQTAVNREEKVQRDDSHIRKYDNSKDAKIENFRIDPPKRKAAFDSYEGDRFEDKSKMRKVFQAENEDVNTQYSKPANEKVIKKLTPSDQKRLDAIKGMKESYKNKVNLLRSTLSNVDRKPTNKIVFDDDGEAIVSNNREDSSGVVSNVIRDKSTKKNIHNTEKTKATLFNDDSSDEEPEYNFEVKKQYQGEAGQKLIELQSRYKADKRFILDERFIEDEDQGDSIEQADIVESVEDNEKTKQIEILEGVLGKSLTSNSKKAPQKTMLRYDPTRSDHSKFISTANNVDKEKAGDKKKKKKLDLPNNEVENDTKPAPVVSQDRYYKVDSTLKQAMENKNPFSLLSLFGDTKSENNENGEYACEPLNDNGKPNKNLVSGSKNPFFYDSSDSEDEHNKPSKKKMSKEELVNSVTEADSEPLVKEESLFFSNDDIRLREGLEFFLNKEQMTCESREKLKFIVKKRIQNNMKNQDYHNKRNHHNKNMNVTKFRRRK